MCGFSNELFAFSKGEIPQKVNTEDAHKNDGAIITEEYYYCSIVVDQDVDTESKLLTSGLGLKRALNDSHSSGDRFFQWDVLDYSDDVGRKLYDAASNVGFFAL